MEKSDLLKCDFASLDNWFPIFLRNVREHFTSYAASHSKILKYKLKFLCTDFKTNRRRNLCPMRFLGAFAKLWKTTIILVMSFCLSICLSDCLSVRLSVCLSVRLSVCPTVYLSDCLSVRLSVCPTVCLECLSVCPMSDCLSWVSVCLECLSVSCPTVCLTVSLPDCLSVWLSVSLHLSIHLSTWTTRLPLDEFSLKMIFNTFRNFVKEI
jgi:hypothetical protein